MFLVRIFACPGTGLTPGYLEQSRRLTAARAADPWLAVGSQTVQQQALRDFAQAIANFFDGNCDRPTWRKAGQSEGFLVTGTRGRGWDFRRVNRKRAEVQVPKVGWVRFRLSRPVPEDVKSYRVTRDRAGRWHVAFAAVPQPVPGPGTGEVAGIDRGVKVTAALSTGEMVTVPHRVEDLRAKNMMRSAKGTCGSACNADVNAARNIAAGHAVKARGGDPVAGPANREPQLALLSV